MTANPNGGPTGFAVIDKASGWTSHDVVAKARGIFGTRKVGHSGTLDPGATGVLILGLGRATRLLRFVTALPKTYIGEAVLGVETDSLDADGAITETYDMAGVQIDEIRQAAASFVGEISQVPPMVSAVKVGGKRLHQLAREGKSIEREPRLVTVHQLEVEELVEPTVFRFSVTCSSGTYIRTIAADLGLALGGGAHLRSLRRTAIGSHTEAHARALERAEVISVEEGLADYPRVVVGGEDVARVRSGQRLEPDRFLGDGPWVLLGDEGQMLAMHERSNGVVKAGVVLG